MSTNDNPNFDTYSQISSKLGFLFRAEQDATVLLIGHRALKWGEDFKNYFSVCDETAVFTSDEAKKLNKNNRMYDLIILDASISQQTDKEETLRDLREHLSSKGHMMLIAGNKYSLNKIKTFVNGGVADSLGLSLNRYKKILKKSGFTSIRAFLPMPNVNDMEEIVSEHIKTVQLPAYYHPIYKIANRCKFYKHIHDAYIFVSSPASEDGISYFIEGFQSELKSVTRRTYKFSLDRFDMRARGSLVLFVSDSAGKEKFVVRIAVTPEIDLKIKKNSSWLHFLLANKNVLNEVKNKLPKPVTDFQYNGKKVYVEEMVSGILAWKMVANNYLLGKIETEAMKFLKALEISTTRYEYVDKEVYDRFISRDIEKVSSVISRNVALRVYIENIISYLEKKLIYKWHRFVFSHGDFGYGNILINPDSGDITGIIDWDGARQLDLPGIDFLNFTIQKNRICNGSSLHQEIRCLWSNPKILDSNQSFDMDFYQIQLSATVVRYVIRAAEYPSIFACDVSDFTDALKFIKDSIPA